VISPTSLVPGAAAVKSRPIRSAVAGAAGSAIVVPPGPGLAGDQPEPAHQRPHQLRRDGHPAPGQRGVDPPVAVRAVRVVKDVLDEFGEHLPARQRGRFRPVPPFVEPGPGHGQPVAHFRDGVGVLLPVDEFVHRIYR
jgi:hypothetical protein